MDLMPVLAGFLQSRGQQAKFDREQAIKKPQIDLQSKLVQLQLQKEKTAFEETKMKQQLINSLLQGVNVQGQEVPIQKDKPLNAAVENAKNGGVADKIAFMDPRTAALMKYATDIDMLGAGRLAEQQKTGQRLESQGRERIEETKRHNRMVEDQYEKEEIINADGSKEIRYRKKYGPPSYHDIGTQKVAPPPVETHQYIEKGQTFEVIRNKRDGTPVTEPKLVKPLKGETSETASKIALAKNAIEYTEQLYSAFVNPDGTINRDLIFKANAPMGGIGDGRKAKAMFTDALDARARAASGAAMPESEIATYTKMYFPSPLDNDATIIDKLSRLDSFMKDYLNTMDPTGKIQERLGVGKKSGGEEAAFAHRSLNNLINYILTKHVYVDMIYNIETGKLEPVK